MEQGRRMGKKEQYDRKITLYHLFLFSSLNLNIHWFFSPLPGGGESWKNIHPWYFEVIPQSFGGSVRDFDEHIITVAPDADPI